jgi:hypothetical protein
MQAIIASNAQLEHSMHKMSLLITCSCSSAAPLAAAGAPGPSPIILSASPADIQAILADVMESQVENYKKHRYQSKLI